MAYPANIPPPLLTCKELSLSSMPDMAIRLSQRQSKSRTKAVAPRTFTALEPWPRFIEDARGLSDTLDNTVLNNCNPMIFPDEEEEEAAPADEVDIRGAMKILFVHVNKLARKSGKSFRYLSGGSGRSLSFTDMLILDRGQQQPTQGRASLSNRVFGCGEAKGEWQWTLGGRMLEAALNDPKKKNSSVEVLQQLFGDMVMDESQLGFLTNYRETIFFRRLNGKSKALQYSPVIKLDEAPLEKFLFALDYAEQMKGQKHLFSRTLVRETPKKGYDLRLSQVVETTSTGQRNKRKAIDINVRAQGKAKQVKVEVPEDKFQAMPVYEMEELGINGIVRGYGKYGNIMVGRLGGRDVVVKAFDLRFEDAGRAFLTEEDTYKRLEALQGVCVPLVVAAGRLAHMSVPFLALTDAGNVREKLTIASEKKILAVLDEIHDKGVLHGDLKHSHVCWMGARPMLIDFDRSKVDAAEHELLEETREMEELLLSSSSS